MKTIVKSIFYWFQTVLMTFSCSNMDQNVLFASTITHLAQMGCTAHVPSLAAGVALQRAARLRCRRATGSRAAAAAKINVQLTPKLGQSGKKARSI